MQFSACISVWGKKLSARYLTIKAILRYLFHVLRYQPLVLTSTFPLFFFVFPHNPNHNWVIYLLAGSVFCFLKPHSSIHTPSLGTFNLLKHDKKPLAWSSLHPIILSDNFSSAYSSISSMFSSFFSFIFAHLSKISKENNKKIRQRWEIFAFFELFIHLVSFFLFKNSEEARAMR